jgi:hypothetical protein
MAKRLTTARIFKAIFWFFDVVDSSMVNAGDLSVSLFKNINKFIFWAISAFTLIESWTIKAPNAAKYLEPNTSNWQAINKSQ